MRDDHALLFGQDNLRQLRLDLIALRFRGLYPEVATILGDTFTKLNSC